MLYTSGTTVYTVIYNKIKFRAYLGCDFDLKQAIAIKDFEIIRKIYGEKEGRWINAVGS